MQLSADEISSIIKKQIQNFDRAALVSETGTVLTRVTASRASTAWQAHSPVSSSSSRAA